MFVIFAPRKLCSFLRKIGTKLILCQNSVNHEKTAPLYKCGAICHCLIILLYVTSNFVRHVEHFWSTCHVEQNCSIWNFCSTDNVCGICDNFDVWLNDFDATLNISPTKIPVESCFVVNFVCKLFMLGTFTVIYLWIIEFIRN